MTRGKGDFGKMADKITALFLIFALLFTGCASAVMQDKAQKTGAGMKRLWTQAVAMQGPYT